MTTSGGRKADARRQRRGPAQYLLGLLLALAIGASVAMIFSPTRSIVASLAVIAALWAAVIGAILVTKFRRQADSAEAKTRDLRLVYELQLEREITARRQYELGVEAQIRKEVRAETNEELHELQAQVAALRSSLELLVGELPEQRVALSTERYPELERTRGPQQQTAILDDSVVAERDFAGTAPTETPASRSPQAPAFTEAPVFTDETPTDEWATPAPSAPAPSAPAPSAPAPSVPAPLTPEPTAAPEPPPVATPRPPQPPVTTPPVETPAASSGRHGRSAAVAASAPGSAPEPEPQPVVAPETASEPEPEAVADTTAAWDTSASTRGRDRHRAPETEPGAHANGRSVSELIEQFRAPTPGGRRRRRD
ncbi:DUF6779 domain-containing protein [Williamsia sp. Leaf354]|uniref:DUF6779 domain-containing protein n=1 Tax=Williamsia sp. Leaf354 TaxID=1736349 RepID=UPI0009E77A02|nr:DUF6779 domain-containing protein [Williamsia sp. Leaf354]